MVPGLPHVFTDVPANDQQAPARQRLLDLPARHLPQGEITRSRARRRSIFLRSFGVALSVMLSLSLVSTALAEDLNDRRDEVERQIKQTRADLNESTQQLSAAVTAVNRAQVALEQAQAELAQTRQELVAARAEDRRIAKKLKQARIDLAAARLAVIKGQQALDAELVLAGNVVRDQYQQQTNLLPIAMLVEPNSMADLQTRLQWSTTMFDTSAAQIDRLTILQRALNAKRAAQTELEARVSQQRKAAAANLRLKKQLEQRAAQQEASVGVLVQQRQVAQEAAAQDVADEKSQYATLVEERASVERRIAERIAAAKAEAARKAAAAKRAAGKRAAAAAAQKARQARQRAAAAKRKVAQHSRSVAKASRQSVSAPSRPKARPPSRPSRASSASSRGGFIRPVAAAITSSYGLRLHPVLRVWKLHDGTDFGAGCGAVIRAPYSGRVAERYYNTAYGNRLMIDHGRVNGRYVTTGYNHAVNYTVGVGQRVSKGQVIGYVGTTGYSTGCHLHLMVWLDGSLTNPMSWF